MRFWFAKRRVVADPAALGKGSLVKTWVVVLTVSICFLVSPALLDQFHCYRVNSKARSLQVGDTKERVRKLLGEPDAWFGKSTGWFGSPCERWAYGSNFDWADTFHKDFPYFFPFRFRFFGPASGDVSIEFDDVGKVARVRFPVSE